MGPWYNYIRYTTHLVSGSKRRTYTSTADRICTAAPDMTSRANLEQDQGDGFDSVIKVIHSGCGGTDSGDTGRLAAGERLHAMEGLDRH